LAVLSSYHDEIWASVPADRPIDEAAAEWALATAARAGERPRVLDLGCGDGRIAGLLARNGADVTGVDPSPVALERARSAHRAIEFTSPALDGTLPFDDGSFGAVVCLNVLEHVADTQRLMSETRRVSLPGAWIALAVPSHGRLQRTLTALSSFERHYDPLEPVLRFYTRRSLTALVEGFGYGELELAEAGGAPLFRRTLLARARR
jgi:SAM-dependent methyltransferase